LGKEKWGRKGGRFVKKWGAGASLKTPTAKEPVGKQKKKKKGRFGSHGDKIESKAA